MIALIDCNNFFVSCERSFNPALEGKPVIVLSGNDGCVISRSNEAKKLGIPMGTPLFKVQEIIERHNVVLHSSNFALYHDMSRRVMRLIAREGLPQEVYSVDECFLNIHAGTTAQEMAHALRAKILRGLGIPVSIGLASTKTLAKIAATYAKKHPAYKGVCLIGTAEQHKKALASYPVEDVWGIGRQSAEKLKRYGIQTAAQFAELPEGTVRRLLTISGVRTQKELRGIESFPFAPEQPRQSISASRSLATEINDPLTLRQIATTFLTDCCRTLRAEGLHAQQLSLLLATNPFKENTPQHRETRALQLEVPTSDPLELTPLLTQLLEKVARPNCHYKKVGVSLSKLVRGAVTPTLFDKVNREKRALLLNSLDTLEKRYGKNTVHLAAATTSAIEQHTRREHLSRAYTTKLSDIIEIHTDPPLTDNNATSVATTL